jgi:hypothetical protein
MSEDELIDVIGLHPSTGHGFPGGDNAQIDRGDVGERPEEATDRRSRPFDDDGPLHEPIVEPR